MRGGAQPESGVGFSRATRFAQAAEEIGHWLEENRLPGYPLYYNETTQLYLNSVASGLRGGLGRVPITLSNYPHAIFGIMVESIYEVPDEFLAVRPDYYALQRAGGIDDAMSIRVSLTQQNVTQQPVPIATFTGGGSSKVWRPWPTIYWYRGANVVTVEVRRLVSYPLITIPEPLQTFRPVPEVNITVVSVQLNSDYFPGGSPGSTGRP